MIASADAPDSLLAQIYRAFRAFHRANSHDYKINHLRISTPSEGVYAGVMQDKVTSNIVERICTTLLIPPVMGWHDMYSIYNLPG
jgi:hypothetical protein